MKKLASIVIASVIALSAVLNFDISFVRAASDPYFKSVSFEALPSDSRIVEGYVNSTNTSFRINVEPKDDFITYKMSLYLDDMITPLDVRLFDNGSSYIFSSNTSTVGALESLLGNGSHEWRIMAQDAEVVESYVVASGEFVSDFASPDGKFFAEQIIPGDAPSKVGDTVAIGLAELLGTADINSVTGKIYGRDLTFVKKGRLFYANYLIEEGDPDQTANLKITDAIYEDTAGNQVVSSDLSIPIDFSIDANSPTISLTSPQNKTYTNKNILVSYVYSGATILSATLDGQPIDVASGGELVNLAEGLHDFSIQVMDEAGNKSTSLVQFIIDTIAPLVTLGSNSSSIIQGDTYRIDGVGESCATVELSKDGVLLASGSCDQSGKFNLKVVTNGWAIGQHSLVLTVTDEFGNSSEAIVSVNIKKRVVITHSVRVASVASVASGLSQSEPEDNLEVARAGRIISSNDTQPDKPVNWMAWLILAGLIVLAGAIATTSYYGFAWLTLNRKTDVSEMIVEPEISEKADEEFSQINVDHEKESEKNDPPEEPKNYTRW